MISKLNLTIFLMLLTIIPLGCSKKPKPSDTPPTYVISIGNDIRRLDIGNIKGSPAVYKADINGDFIVFINDNPIARNINSCSIDLNQFLHIGTNTISLKGKASTEFQLLLDVLKLNNDYMNDTTNIISQAIKPNGNNEVYFEQEFKVNDCYTTPIYSHEIPSDKEAVEKELKNWFVEINKLIEQQSYESVYQNIFTYHDAWFAKQYGMSLGDYSSRTEAPGFKMCSVSMDNIRFVQGKNIVLAYDVTIKDDRGQGIITAESDDDYPHTIITYLRFICIDGQWKNW